MTSYSGYFGHIFSQWNEVETSHLSFGLVNAHTQSYFFTFFTSFLCKPHTLYVMFYDNICSLLVNFYLPAVDSPCHTTSMLDVHLGYSLHTLSFIYPLVWLWSPSIHWTTNPWCVWCHHLSVVKVFSIRTHRVFIHDYTGYPPASCWCLVREKSITKDCTHRARMLRFLILDSLDSSAACKMNFMRQKYTLKCMKSSWIF